MKTYKSTEDSYLLVLERGEEIMTTITSWANANSIRGASISGIGALTDVTLGFYDLETQVYDQKEFHEEYELISLMGNLSSIKGKYFVHLHAQLSNSSYQCIGGHLFSAKVAVTAEVYIQLQGTLPAREFNKEIGLNLITGLNN